MIDARLRRIGVLVLVAGLCAWMLVVFAGTAHRKQFWMDEGFEAVLVCERPAARMLVEGSFGCSPAPLFSIAQRLVIRSVEPLGLSMRVTYRAVSLAAGTLARLVLLGGGARRRGCSRSARSPAVPGSTPTRRRAAPTSRG